MEPHSIIEGIHHNGKRFRLEVSRQWGGWVANLICQFGSATELTLTSADGRVFRSEGLVEDEPFWVLQPRPAEEGE